MAVLFVTEYGVQGRDMGGYRMVVPEEPPLANQTVAITAGSVQSSAFNANTRLIRVHTDAICSIEFGTNPTATTTTRRLAANTTEYFAVPAATAGTFKVAVIINT